MSDTPYPNFPNKLMRPAWFKPHWQLWEKSDRITVTFWAAFALLQLVMIAVTGGGMWLNWVFCGLFLVVTVVNIHTANLKLDTKRLTKSIEDWKTEHPQYFADPYLQYPYRAPDDYPDI